MSVADPQAQGAVVVAREEETRVLLRGLLRLHHVRVDGEAEGAAHALELLRRVRPSIVVADVQLADGTWGEVLAATRAAGGKPRFILVAPASRPAPVPPDGGAPDVVLLRPFRIRAFADALLPTEGSASG